MKKILSFVIFIGVLFSQSLIIDSRVMGGEIIPKDDISKPWLVKLDTACTASLINEKFLLTAFHCINEDSIEILREFYVIKARGSETVSKIKNVYLPYKENALNVEADVVVIELAKAIKIDSYIKVPNEDFLDNYYGKQDVALLLGYGENDINATPFQEPVQVKLSIMNRDLCSQLMTKEGRVSVKSSLNYLLCDDAKKDVQRRKKDIGMCAGDSGGPLTVSENSKEFYQIGVVSGFSSDDGSDSCGKNSAFYGNIPYHSKWINNVLSKKIEPNNDYRLDTSDESSFYHSMREITNNTTWIMWGASSILNFDTRKMPSKFSIYVYRDNRFVRYTNTSESIIINKFEGFWFIAK